MNKLGFCFVVLVLATINPALSKDYTNCELARKIKSLGLTDLANWVCLAKWESSYNTNSKGCNSNGRGCDYGIFQINSKYWCQGEDTVTNECGFTCSTILSDVTSTDINCVRKIYARHGFEAWVAWKNNCKGKDLTQYIAGCGV